MLLLIRFLNIPGFYSAFLLLDAPAAVYLVSPNGQFSHLWPKEVTLPLLADAVSRAVKE
jgi:hypothetical protein